MKQWREDAQPEWPEAATATGEVPSDSGARDGRATQVFPDRDVRTTGHRLPAGTEILRGIPRQSEGEADSLAPQPGNRTAVRDPWQEQEEAGAEPSADTPDTDGQTHDPHEVTVQLDAVQLGEGFLRQVKEGPGAEAAADRPVFVDESGRRSRRYRRIGMAVALACGAYAVVIAATLMSGNSNAPWLPVPTKEDNPPAGQVDTPSLPAESAPTTGTGATAPGSTPATGQATAPAPGPSAAAPDATAGTGPSGTSAKPSPNATRTVPAPGGKATAPAPTKPADPPSTPATDPTPTAEPTATPTETTGTGGDGGTVAEGPAEPQPVAEGPAEPQPVAETPVAA
ncbi:hypothetical protein [Streptomyces paradoxus]|uniref:Uncharacterized protein n=1 Tax=Streptomyces paradoxus TaxID=66375 RepID=A0A7W9T8F2_9ACTN|nr:hypothetical protein [Streptomyces paradoxus]MBB6075990.1 hypothetical protein [Streptomyces paradoxus]